MSNKVASFRSNFELKNFRYLLIKYQELLGKTFDSMGRDIS